MRIASVAIHRGCPMARQFDIPTFYRSDIISRLKRVRQARDPKKRDLTPTLLDFGSVRFVLARHFGFCFGVENAIEIAFKTLNDHPDRRVFFLSEMIHNPNVNDDLQSRGVRFIFTTDGRQLIPWRDLHADDIVVVPAFGATLEIERELSERGIDPYTFNTTCPFVEKVWKLSMEVGVTGYTVVIHGKARHEETRATFSHSVERAPTLVVLDLEEAKLLADVIRGDLQPERFTAIFGPTSSPDFDPDTDLARIGVVNQTTMLASETREITAIIRQALIDRYGKENLNAHFADTSDTLCYATNENQNATYALIDHGADLALVVGGYNSSNTSHLVNLLENAFPTYFIRDFEEVLSAHIIRHFDLSSKQVVTSRDWLPEGKRTDIVLTCGASCPDAVVDAVLLRVLSFFPDAYPVNQVMADVESTEAVLKVS